MPADVSTPPSGSVLRRGWGLIRAVVALHPRPFLTAVASAAVFAVLTVASAWAMSRLIDHVVLPRFEQGHVGLGAFAAAAGLVIGIGVVRGAAVVMRRTFAGRAQWRVAQTLTGSVTDRILAQPQAWQDRFSTGDLVARTGVDVDATVAVMAPLPFASSTIVLIVVASAWLLSLDLVLGAVAVALFPLLAGLNVVYQHKVERHTSDAQDHLGGLSGAVHESFDGVMLVKALGAEDREADRLATVAAQLLQARVRAVRIRSTFDSVMNNMPTLASVALVALGAWRIEQGHLTVGELTSVLYLFTLIALPIRLIGFALSEMPYSLAGWDRLRQVLDDPVAPPADRAIQRVPGAGISVEGVSFAFEPGRPVVDDATFTIGQGRIAALVGPTGSGKTTLLELIAGLYTPDVGSITRPPGGCALVFQEAFLFGESIEQNLVLGAGGVGAQAISRALAIADAAEFVDRLPAGIATVMGERGVSVSGGQRQRLALARAVVADPSVLLLDDTTSALDPATEGRVLANLRSELAGVTTLIVASRPSTIALADDVVFLQAGRVVAIGPHAELYAGHRDYRALVDAYEIERRGGDA